MASEVGVIDVEDSEILMKSNLSPGRMLLVDTLKKEITSDEDIKKQIFSSRPTELWLNKSSTLNDLHEIYKSQNPNFEEITTMSMRSSTETVAKEQLICIEEDRRLPLFGYNFESLRMLILPMIKEGKETLGSMGNDTPLACLSSFNPLVYDYFKQLFAQVTNPPIDPLREKLIMSVACPIGPEGNILEPSADQCDRLYIDQPIFSLENLYIFKNINYRNYRVNIYF